MTEKIPKKIFTQFLQKSLRNNKFQKRIKIIGAQTAPTTVNVIQKPKNKKL